MKEQLSKKYDELIEINEKFIQKYLRKGYKKNIFLEILLTILVIPLFALSLALSLFFFEELGFFIFFLGLFVFLNSYRKMSLNFTERVALTLLKELKFVIEVDSKKYISKNIYQQANFRDFYYNRYRGEKYIKVNIDNNDIEMSKVFVEEHCRGSNHDFHTYTRFNGIVIVSNLSEVITDGYIHIFNDKDDSRVNLFKKQNKEKVNMDSMEFEMEFDVYATDSIVALEILTSDMMQKFIDNKKKIDCKYEVSITKNMIIMRIFKNENIFEERCQKGKLSPTAEGVKEFILRDVEFIDNVSRFISDITCDICNKFNI